MGRNDPCPCGSGRKYKRCCWAKHAAERAAAAKREGARGESRPAEAERGRLWEEATRLDEWSNAARDHLDAGRLIEADALSARLIAEYADQIDGYEIRGRVRQAQGRWAEAAEAYHRALEVALAQGEGAFDPLILDELRAQAEQARRACQADGGPARSNLRDR